MNRSITVTVLLLLTVSLNLSAQKKYYWKDILATISTDSTDLEISETDSLIINTTDYDNFITLLGKNSPNGKLVVNRKVSIVNPRIRNLSWGDFELVKLHFKKDVYIEIENTPLTIRECMFEDRAWINFSGGDRYALSVQNNTLLSWIYIESSGSQRIYFMDNILTASRSDYSEKGIDKIFLPVVEFGHVSSKYVYPVLDTLTFYGQKTFSFNDNLAAKLNIRNCMGLLFNRNTIRHEGHSSTILNITNCNSASFAENIFDEHDNFILSGSVNSFFKLSGNGFNGLVSFSELNFPDKSDIEFSDIKGRLSVVVDTTVILRNIPARYYSNAFDMTDSETALPEDSLLSTQLKAQFLFEGKSSESLLTKRFYKSLIKSYKTLYDNYKSQADLESVNGCFVAVKDLEGKKLKEVYNLRGGFKNYFSWKLNRLMKFYTNYATEPELALVISVYVILAFAIFYFFFPSEWDLESKSKLVTNFREFVEKNDKGYIRPFFRMTGGLLISLANAMTLSLNSFITLGFGNIPTSGLARYVCIIEGFIGWFLLSIFTVTLFNQVLF